MTAWASDAGPDNVRAVLVLRHESTVAVVVDAGRVARIRPKYLHPTREQAWIAATRARNLKRWMERLRKETTNETTR